MTKRAFAAICAFVAALLAAQPDETQARMISYAYDGVYVGATPPAPGLSEPFCEPLPLNRIEIKNGALRAYDGGRQSVKGFVTHDGFFNADYYFPGRQGVVFEGAIDDAGRLTGGIMDGGCAWIVNLLKTTRM